MVLTSYLVLVHAVLGGVGWGGAGGRANLLITFAHLLPITVHEFLSI